MNILTICFVYFNFGVLVEHQPIISLLHSTMQTKIALSNTLKIFHTVLEFVLKKQKNLIGIYLQLIILKSVSEILLKCDSSAV